MNIEFELDGSKVNADVPPMTLLADLLRDQFKIKSIHKGCRSGECGACTVLIENSIALSCLVPVFSIRGKKIITIEGIRKTKEYTTILKAFNDAEYDPCSYCRPSKILSLYALLEINLNPDDDEILSSLSGTSCYCTGYSNLQKAAGIAAASIRRKRRARKR